MLCKEFQRRRRYVFELGSRGAASSAEFHQCSLVEVLRCNVIISHRASGAVTTGIEHTNFVAERLRRHAEHAAELPAAQQPEPRTRRNRVH